LPILDLTGNEAVRDMRHERHLFSKSIVIFMTMIWTGTSDNL
jgi:hypothetical protein